MSEPLFKIVNVVDEKTGQSLLDPKTQRPLSRRVQMTDEEAAAFRAEQAAAQAETPKP